MPVHAKTDHLEARLDAALDFTQASPIQVAILSWSRMFLSEQRFHCVPLMLASVWSKIASGTACIVAACNLAAPDKARGLRAESAALPPGLPISFGTPVQGKCK